MTDEIIMSAMRTYELDDDGGLYTGILCDGKEMEFEAVVSRLNALESIKSKVEAWAQAYPLEQFPEPDMHLANSALLENDISLGCVSASSMRHVITRVAQMFAGT